MPTSDNGIAGNASESENGDVIVRNYSSDSLKVSRESRIPIRTSSGAEKVGSKANDAEYEMKIEPEQQTIGGVEEAIRPEKSTVVGIKAALSSVNEFISIEPPARLGSSDESDVVVQVFNPKRKRSRSLGHRKQVIKVIDQIS